jgi:exonuclease III
MVLNPAMRLATWNINNINKRLPLLLAWLEATKPELVALQELKAATDAFPRAAMEAQATVASSWVSGHGTASHCLREIPNLCWFGRRCLATRLTDRPAMLRPR